MRGRASMISSRCHSHSQAAYEPQETPSLENHTFDIHTCLSSSEGLPLWLQLWWLLGLSTTPPRRCPTAVAAKGCVGSNSLSTTA